MPSTSSGTEIVTLGEVLEYEQPTKYLVKSENYNDKYDTPVLTAGQSFILGYTNEKEGIFEKFPVIIFDDFTTATKFVDFPFKVKSSALKVLIPKLNLINIRYVFHLLQTIKIDNERHKRYWISQFSNIQIPLPPLPEQQRIAQLLDTADLHRQKTAQLLEQYNQLAQSLFLDMFGDPIANPKGWEVKELGEICDFRTKGIAPENFKKEYHYIGLEHIEKDTGKIIEKLNIEDINLKSNKFWFDENYILYGKLRPYLNKVANADFEGVCSTDIIPVKPIINKSVKEYILHFLKGKWFVDFADKNCSGANLPRISPKKISNYKLISPPIHLQNQFAKKIAQIEQQKAILQQELQHAENLFGALLQQSFSGKDTN